MGVTSQMVPLLQVRGLCKYFPVLQRGFFARQIATVKAADDINFDLMPGETLGLVGESGCGKTTTARTVLRALTPTSGQILFQKNGSTVDLAALSDRELKPLRTQMQMIFQDPFSSLNPRMTVGDIVGEPLTVHRMAYGSDREDRVADMLTKVGLRVEHMHRYPHAFSGGQRQRIGIARALIMKPSMVVADEAVSALDVSVQAQVINLLEDLQDQLNLTYIFVAHDLSVVRHICDRIAVMYAGRIVEVAETEEIFENAKHPYTQGLISAVPHPDPDIPMTFEMGGEVADPANLPSGCSFNPRCPYSRERCLDEVPRLRTIEGTRTVGCHYAEELALD